MLSIATTHNSILKDRSENVQRQRTPKIGLSELHHPGRGAVVADHRLIIMAKNEIAVSPLILVIALRHCDPLRHSLQRNPRDKACLLIRKRCKTEALSAAGADDRGRFCWMHKSPYHGFSVEFADHREYNSGDPVKNIDWKIVAKTDRYYVKRFEEETNLRCYIILDHSRSMFYASEKSSKIDYACRLAAALSWLMIGQKDAAGLITFNETITSMLPPKAYRGYLAQIFRVLAELEPKDSTRFLENLHKAAQSIRKRSLIILISDLLEDPEKIIDGLRHFRSQHHEVLVFHVADLQEDNFDFRRETEFVDSETGEKITVNPWQIRKEYLENYSEHIQKLKAAVTNIKLNITL